MFVISMLTNQHPNSVNFTKMGKRKNEKKEEEETR